MHLSIRDNVSSWIENTGAICSRQIPKFSPAVYPDGFVRKSPLLLRLILFFSGAMYAAEPPVLPAPLASPQAIAINQPTILTVAISLPQVTLLPLSVRLLRLAVSGETIATLGTPHDDGLDGDQLAGDRIFTIQLPIANTNPGHMLMVVSAAFTGQLRRVISPQVDVPIVERLAQIGPTGGSLDIPGDQAPLAGLRVTFPNGALRIETQTGVSRASWPPISTRLENATFGAQAFELVPHGLSFDVPVRLSIPFNPSAVNGPSQPCIGLATIEGGRLSAFDSLFGLQW